jgi:hypothetical protein
VKDIQELEGLLAAKMPIVAIESMAEKVAALREWARERTVPAD